MTFVQRIFLSIHFLGTCALIVLLSLLMGCIQPPDADNGNPKVEFQLADLASTMINLSPTPDNIKVGDFVWQGLSLSTFTNPEDIQSQYTYTVTAATPGSGTYKGTPFNFIDYHMKRGEYDGTGNTLIQMAEGDCELWKGPIPNVFPNIGWNGLCKIGSDSLAPYQDQFFGLRDQPYGTLDNIRFYNLSVNPKSMSLPARMVENSKCYNYAGCNVEGASIEFDLEQTDVAPPSNYRHYKIFISNALPYLASNLETCAKYQVLIKQSVINVTQCTRILDFDIGK